MKKIMSGFLMIIALVASLNQQSFCTEKAKTVIPVQTDTRILINNGDSGEIYGGLRWKDWEDKSQWLSLKNGTGGLRITSNDGTKEFLSIDNFGGIYLNGDVYLNGKMISNQKNAAIFVTQADFIMIIGGIIFLFLTIQVLVIYFMSKRFKNLKESY